ncbi:phage late control D family protein [Mycobacterium sp. NPDC004974]
MTEPAISFGTPVFTVKGEPVPDLARDCVKMEIDEGVEGLKTLRLYLNAAGPGAPGPPEKMQYLDGRQVDFGVALQVAIGPRSGQRVAFDGVISAIEAVFADAQPPLVVVSAEDMFMRLRMTRRSHTYTDATDADIVDEIARFHGLRAEVDADGPRYDVVQQLNQSDLAFLRERARLTRAELWCDGNVLHYASRTRRNGTKLTLVQSNELLGIRLCADLAHQRTEVVVTGYDARTAETIEERADSAVVAAEAAPGRVGPDALEKALGASVSLRVREVALNSAEAAAYAKAEMLRRARGFVTVMGTTRGTPDMTVGSILDLRAVGTAFEGGGYYVTRVQHTFDLERGLRTHFEAERSTVNLA